MEWKRFKQQPPLFKLGPGGEFSYEIIENQEKPVSETVSNPLLKVLEVIADLVGGSIQPELLMEDALANLKTPAQPVSEVENIAHENQSQSSHHHTQAVGSPSGNRKLSGQALLFADDGRTGRHTGRKPANGIRTYRRTARKKSGGAIQRQGSLFSPYAKGKKTA
jgi:hypothetical protein